MVDGAVQITVEVVYALAEQQHSETLHLPAGATVQQALAQVASTPGFSDLQLADHAVGVFGEVCDHQRVLLDGDRLEIYRPLVTDAKTARRQRADAEKSATSNTRKKNRKKGGR